MTITPGLCRKSNPPLDSSITTLPPSHTPDEYPGQQAVNFKSLVTEVAHAGEDHSKACFIGSIDHVLILDGTTWLDHAGCTRFSRLKQTIREWEECVRRSNTAFGARY